MIARGNCNSSRTAIRHAVLDQPFEVTESKDGLFPVQGVRCAIGNDLVLKFIIQMRSKTSNRWGKDWRGVSRWQHKAWCL